MSEANNPENSAVKGIALLLICFLANPVFAETVYKAKDSSGNIIYSDQPTEKSEEIKINPPPSYSSPPMAGNSQGENAPPPPQEVSEYQLSVVEPKQDQVFTNDIESIEVKLSVQPQLQDNDRIQMFLNGDKYGPPLQSPTVHLISLPRGTYKISAEIFKGDDPSTIKGKTGLVTFHQQRNVAKPEVKQNLAPQAPQAPKL